MSQPMSSGLEPPTAGNRYRRKVRTVPTFPKAKNSGKYKRNIFVFFAILFVTWFTLMSRSMSRITPNARRAVAK